jgi:hypothetical protein
VAKKAPPSTASETKTSHTAIQSAIRNLRLPANHVLIKTSQGYSIVNSALLQNAQFCAALNPTVIRTVASTTVTSSITPGKAVTEHPCTPTTPVVKVMTATSGVSIAPPVVHSGARSVLIQQLSKPLPSSTAPNVAIRKVTTISAIPIPPKTTAQHTENYVHYSGLADMPQHMIQELIKQQRKGEVTKPIPTTTPAAKILSSMLNTPDATPKTSTQTTEARAVSTLPVTCAPPVHPTSTSTSNTVTSVLSLSSVTQPINAENWNALLKANPGLLKLVQSPQKSAKYASNITVKSLLETRASQQKSPKSELNEPKPLTVVVTEHQDVVMTDLSPLPLAQAQSLHIDEMVQSVLSPVKTTLPTVQMKIPSPSTLPAIAHHSVTSTTRAMKVPILAAMSPTVGTKNTSTVIKVPSTTSLTVPGAPAQVGTKIVLGAKQTNQIGSIIGGEQKNIVLKVVPQTIMTTQGLVQGYVTPQGLFIPKQMLNTPTVLSVKPDESPTSSAPTTQVLNTCNTANQTVKAMVSPGTVQTQQGQGALLQVTTNPSVTSPQKIVINRGVSGSQVMNVAQGVHPAGLLQVPATLPLSGVPLNASNRGVVVQKHNWGRGGIVTTAVRNPVMSPTVARHIDFNEATTTANTEVTPVRTNAPSVEEITSPAVEVQSISTENLKATSTSSSCDSLGDISSILGRTDADTVAALQSLVQLSGLAPPEPCPLLSQQVPISNNQTGSNVQVPTPRTNQSVPAPSVPNTSDQVLSTVNQSANSSHSHDLILDQEAKTCNLGKVGLHVQRHAAARGLHIQKPQGANVYTVNIAKTEPNAEQLAQQKIIMQNILANVLTPVPQVVRADQVSNISPQKGVEAKVVNSSKVQLTPQQLVGLQKQPQVNQQIIVNGVAVEVPSGNVAKNSTLVLPATATDSGNAPSSECGMLVQSLGVPAQGTLKVSDQGAGSAVAFTNVPASTCTSSVHVTVPHQASSVVNASNSATKVQQTVHPAQVVGQPTGQVPGQQKLILFNIGGQLVTPQGIPVTISQGVVKMLPKTTSAPTSAANSLKQAQLQLALQQLQSQQQLQVKVQQPGPVQSQVQQRGQSLAGQVVNAPAPRLGQLPGGQLQLVTTPLKQQAPQQLLQPQLDQTQLLNQLKQSHAQSHHVVQSSPSQPQTRPQSSVQVAQRPVTVHLPQQQIALQQGFLQQLQQQIGQKSQAGQVVPQSNVVMQVLPQNINHLQQSLPQSGVQHVQLATGAQASVHGMQIGQQVVGGVQARAGQQVVQLGQQSVQQVQHTAGVSSSGHQVQQIVSGVQLVQPSVQQLVGGMQLTQQARQVQIQPQSGVQVLQQGSIATTPGTQQQAIQVAQPGQTVVRFQQLQQLMQQQATLVHQHQPGTSSAN